MAYTNDLVPRSRISYIVLLFVLPEEKVVLSIERFQGGTEINAKESSQGGKEKCYILKK